MDYLPRELTNARVLVTVKTYPKPSRSYHELVCTAGLYNEEKWIRIYPVAFRFLQNASKYPKYSVIELDLERKSGDFRPESYTPRNGIDEEIRVIKQYDTAQNWHERRQLVLRDVNTSMDTMIKRAQGDEKVSLGTLKPKEVVDFTIKKTAREWNTKYLSQAKQGDIFEVDRSGNMIERNLVRKLPYKFSYSFLTEGDAKPRTLMIEDWELGTLFFKCLHACQGDEEKACQQVRKKYFDEFVSRKDLYFFVGTTKRHHNVSPNPFIIIGVFYPPKTHQLTLFDTIDE